MAPTIDKLLDLARQAEAAGTGYDQGQRWDWLDRVTKQIIRGAEADCSALTLGLYWLAGYPVDVSGLAYTSNAEALCRAAGFGVVDVTGWDAARLYGALKAGDGLLGRPPAATSGHIVLVGDDGRWLSAEQDEAGRSAGGQAGDQTGVEVLWRKPYMRSRGWTRILRPPADPPVAAPLVAGGLTHRVRWASELNVRATAPSGGKLGTIVTTVKGGTDGARGRKLPGADVLASDGQWWARFEFEGGTRGWVNVNYLQQIGGGGTA